MMPWFGTEEDSGPAPLQNALDPETTFIGTERRLADKGPVAAAK